MRIAITPKSGTNEYKKRIFDILSKKYKCQYFEYTKPKIFDVIIVSWIENNLYNKKGYLSITGLIRFIIKLILIKCCSEKTIYIRHNKFPHRAKNDKLAYKLNNFIEGLFDESVSHSKFKSNKIIKHPLYLSNSCSCNNSNLIKNYNTFDYAVFGRILPYKNIENLIRNWDSDKKLLIFGAGEEKYITSLKKLIKNKMIKIENEFFCDYCAKTIINNCGKLIINTENPRSLVSASYFFGLTSHVIQYVMPNTFFENQVLLGDKNLYFFEDYSELNKIIKRNDSYNESDFINNYYDDRLLHEWIKILEK